MKAAFKRIESDRVVARLSVMLAAGLSILIGGCGGGKAPQEGPDGGTTTPREAVIGVRGPYETAAFLSATTGASSAGGTVSGEFIRLKPSLSDGTSSSVTNTKATLELALFYCRDAVGNGTLRARLFPGARTSSPTSQFVTGAQDVANQLLPRFTGLDVNGDEVQAMVTTIGELVAAVDKETGLNLDSKNRRIMEVLCTVAASAALSGVGRF